MADLEDAEEFSEDEELYNQKCKMQREIKGGGNLVLRLIQC
jgi:hypothetical protein